MDENRKKTLSLSFGTCSDAGIKAENQDALAIQIPREPALTHKGIPVVIADGVSSCQGAQVASQTSVTSFIADYLSTPDSWTVKQAIARVINSLNAWLYQQGICYHGGKQGQVTTFSAVIFKSTTAHIAHVGDSRIYRWRRGELECLTRDHITTIPGQKPVLTGALGLDLRLEVDYKQESLQVGDIYLLMTDGLYSFVEPTTLAAQLSDATDLEQLAATWVALAKQAGSDDNLTCAICRVDELPLPEQEEAYRALTSLPVPPPLSPGNKIDGYHILRELHASKRSQLLLAEDMDSGEKVVLKMPSVNFADDPVYLDAFIREQWIGRRLNHPGILQFLPPRTGQQFLYIVCEYVQGQSLREWMVAHPHADLEQLRQLIGQLAAALRALQRMGVVHQDLKPENIMVDDQLRLKIVDFGSARVAGLGEITRYWTDDAPQGTKNYTAPEIMLGQPASHVSDIFSVGVIAYELLTGQLPFKEVASADFRIKRADQLRYASLRSLRPDLPDWVDAVLAKATCPQVRQRYSALSELVYDLNHPSLQSLPAAPVSPPLLERDPLRFWQALCAALVISNLVWLFLWLNG